MRNAQSPCAADALYGIRTIAVNGKTVGIARLCDAIAAVQALHLSGDVEIKKALEQEASESNYIPETLRDVCGDALLAEYRVACGNIAQE